MTTENEPTFAIDNSDSSVELTIGLNAPHGGRATGDIFITLMGLRSIRGLLNLLIIPGAVLIGISVLLVLANYDILAV